MDMPMNRETWLNQLAAMMAPRFAELGFPLPAFRAAVAFTSAGKSTKVGGECWGSSHSADRKFEIMVSPILDDSMTVAAVLAHELAHAAVGFKHKHQGDFAKCVLALGLVRPLTSSVPGPVFKEWAQPFLDTLGKLPHAKLSWGGRVAAEGDDEGDEEGEGGDAEGGSSNARPKQEARLLKACCAECGYTVRVTSKWVDKSGAPHCPDHGAMQLDDKGKKDD